MMVPVWPSQTLLPPLVFNHLHHQGQRMFSHQMMPVHQRMRLDLVFLLTPKIKNWLIQLAISVY